MLILLALVVETFQKEERYLCYPNHVQWWTVLYSESKSQELPKFLWTWIDRPAPPPPPILSSHCSILSHALFPKSWWNCWFFFFRPDSFFVELSDELLLIFSQQAFFLSNCDWFHAGASKLSDCRMFLKHPITRYEFRCENLLGTMYVSGRILSYGHGILFISVVSGKAIPWSLFSKEGVALADVLLTHWERHTYTKAERTEEIIVCRRKMEKEKVNIKSSHAFSDKEHEFWA